MDKAKGFRLDSAGWGVWSICTILLVGPCIYGSFQLVQRHVLWTVPVGMGVIFAAVVSAFATWALNAVLQSGAERRKMAARKQTKRRK